MLASKGDHQQGKINGLEYLRSFYTLCLLIISCNFQSANTCLRLARRPVMASPVVPSSLRPSPRLRFARRPIFASPVVSSSPLGHHLFTSSHRLCGIVVFCNV
ncbi:hypothetical protein OUZ56_004584 [Daphnia magna]|uniref:Uncharacterized protein n=1 Tax=Daphnia magna TaxID=35525 RepID=A0ABQ9YQ86_9CRUS|nr:hypothetical protein OUZ56_004584 [Daphnia magna]